MSWTLSIILSSHSHTLCNVQMEKEDYYWVRQPSTKTIYSSTLEVDCNCCPACQYNYMYNDWLIQCTWISFILFGVHKCHSFFLACCCHGITAIFITLPWIWRPPHPNVLSVYCAVAMALYKTVMNNLELHPQCTEQVFIVPVVAMA